MHTLFYFHDPMCSWCWGFRPTWLKLIELIPDSIEVKYILGGLAPDSIETMPEATVTAIQSHWRHITLELGTEFNFDFWSECKPRRSTYPACRAVIAAKKQNKEKAMVLGIQEAYYLQAKNPSNVDTLVAIANELKLDINLFKKDIEASATQKALIEQVKLAIAWNVPGFPSLVLKTNKAIYPINLDYKDAKITYKQIMNYLVL